MQVFITLLQVGAGASLGATIGGRIGVLLDALDIPWIDPYSLPIGVVISLILAVIGAWALTEWTDYDLSLTDASTLSVSVVAQYLLDRKYLETWPVWLIVNVASVWLYSQAGMWLFTTLYVFFFFNAFWGWYDWRKAMREQQVVPE